MIKGIVQSREGRIPLKVRGSRRREREIEAVIDTGYTESLSLPPSLIALLGLRWKTLERGTLADGSECVFNVYTGAILWDSKVRHILVYEADADPLVGMALLNGYELKMQICPRGKVTIKRLAKGPKNRSGRK